MNKRIEDYSIEEIVEAARSHPIKNKKIVTNDELREAIKKPHLQQVGILVSFFYEIPLATINEMPATLVQFIFNYAKDELEKDSTLTKWKPSPPEPQPPNIINTNPFKFIDI